MQYGFSHCWKFNRVFYSLPSFLFHRNSTTESHRGGSSRCSGAVFTALSTRGGIVQYGFSHCWKFNRVFYSLPSFLFHRNSTTESHRGGSSRCSGAVFTALST